MITFVSNENNIKRYNKILKGISRSYSGEKYYYLDREVILFQYHSDYTEKNLDFETIPPNSILILEQVDYLNRDEMQALSDLLNYLLLVRFDVEFYIVRS